MQNRCLKPKRALTKALPIIFSFFLCSFSASPVMPVSAEEYTVSTGSGAWTKKSDNLYVMDIDGDGKADVTLTKNGNEWTYQFNAWNTKADGSGRSYTDEQVAQHLTKDASITLYAQWEDAFIKYSHTSNIKNNGDASGTYASNLATTDTVKIDGAKKLKVEVWISTESTDFDWLELRDVNGTKLTKDANGTAIGSSGKLGGDSSSQKPAKSQVFYITGDTVQFYFKSDSSGNYYGYYAIVTQAE